eukprot:Skav213741  [mRNA]  locus=scaffold19:100526:111549:- [translate_table: standard]
MIRWFRALKATVQDAGHVTLAQNISAQWGGSSCGVTLRESEEVTMAMRAVMSRMATQGLRSTLLTRSPAVTFKPLQPVARCNLTTLSRPVCWRQGSSRWVPPVHVECMCSVPEVRAATALLRPREEKAKRSRRLEGRPCSLQALRSGTGKDGFWDGWVMVGILAIMFDYGKISGPELICSGCGYRQTFDPQAVTALVCTAVEEVELSGGDLVAPTGLNCEAGRLYTRFRPVKVLLQQFSRDSSEVQGRLKNVQQIQASMGAFAAICSDGSIVTWGSPDDGGDSSEVRGQLKDVKQIQANDISFVASLFDGSLVTWSDGNDSSDLETQCRRSRSLGQF